MADIKEQAAKIVGSLAGVANIWALDLAIRKGIIAHINKHGALTAQEVAESLGLDPMYTKVLMRALFAGEFCDREGDKYKLAEHYDTLLLDSDHPAYMAGAVKTFVALRETYLDMRTLIESGETEWWSDFDHEWIQAVGENGQTYYRRMLNNVVPQLPRVQEALTRGARYLDIACGTCKGPAKFVRAFPETRVTAVDCDSYSLHQAQDLMNKAGLGSRFEYHESMIEDLDIQGGHDLAIINISLHEAKQIEKAVENVRNALDDGGTFLISEFPFPENEDDCRTVPGKLMCGVQFFEAHIGCQLMPASRFMNLLKDAGFKDVGTIDVNPMHVVIHGTK